MKDEKNKTEALQWLDEALKWYNWNDLELRKEKMNNLEPRMWYDEQTPERRDEQLRTDKLIPLRTPEEGINHLDETRTRIMLCVSFTNLNWWQAMDFGILLIPVERIKIDIAQPWEGLQRTTGNNGREFGKERMNWYDNNGREFLNEPP